MRGENGLKLAPVRQARLEREILSDTQSFYIFSGRRSYRPNGFSGDA